MFATHCLIMRHPMNIHKFQKRHKSFFNRSLIFFFKKNLLLTNSLTSGGCMAIGDMIQQEFEYHSKIIVQHDWHRTMRMMIVGSAIGPLHHYYYLYLDKFLPKVNVKIVIKKILCDQFIAAPLTIVAFFYGMGFLEKKSFGTSTNELKAKFKFVYMGDCMFWPPVQFINFYYLPTAYRVLYINVATMLFNIFLSYTKHYDQH